MNTQLTLDGLGVFRGPEPRPRRLVKTESLGAVPPGMKRRPWRKLSPQQKETFREYNHRPNVKAKRMAAYRERVAKDPKYLEYFRKRNKALYQQDKAKYCERGKKWAKNNRGRYLEWLRGWNMERRKDPHWLLVNRLHSRLWHALEKQSVKKTSKTAILIGCTVNEVKVHLESQFANGMTWQNRHLWDIDHRVPCSLFNFANEDHQRIGFNWRNLQPLWFSHNRSKHDKLPPDTLSLLESITSAIGIDFSAHRPYFTARLAEMTAAK